MIKPFYESRFGKLYHGDCVEVMPQLDITADFVFVSDPPFNVGYHYNTYKDNKPADEYYTWLADVFGTKPQVIIHYPENLYKHSFNIGVFPEKVVSWVYNSNTAKQHRDIAFFNIKPDFTKATQEYKNPSDKRIQKRIAEGKQARLYDWWNVNQVKNVSQDKTEHPAQMPLEVMLNIVKITSGDTIIDPFFGSGTTGVACEVLGRRWIGIEQDLDYCQIAADRIAKAADGFNYEKEIVTKEKPENSLFS